VNGIFGRQIICCFLTALVNRLVKFGGKSPSVWNEF
jgi:hypothetical protein